RREGRITQRNLAIGRRSRKQRRRQVYRDEAIAQQRRQNHFQCCGRPSQEPWRSPKGYRTASRGLLSASRRALIAFRGPQTAFRKARARSRKAEIALTTAATARRFWTSPF